MYNIHGKQGKDSLLMQHAPLVKKIASQMKARLPHSVELDDLIQAGMIGLLDAVNRYEEGHGAQFETYAVQRIRGAILDELRSTDWLPRSIRQNSRKIEDAIHTLTQQLGRLPQETEIARHLSMSLEEYQELLSECGGHQLLYYEDFHSDDGGHEHFLDRFCADNEDPLKNMLDNGFKSALVGAIQSLSEREQLLMSLYYDQELNLKEIGAVLGVSESRVSQLHSQAVSRIRSNLRSAKWTGE